MEPPVVIALKAPATRSGRGAAERDIGDVSGIWAHVSLVTEDQCETLAPPRNDLLLGRTVDSIHSNPDDPTVGYATFTNLAIAEPGTYCLRISLIDMDGSSFGQVANNGTNLNTVHSTIVHVTPNAEVAQPGEAQLQTLSRLRQQGVIP